MAFNLSYLFERKEALLPAVPQLVTWLQEGRILFPARAAFLDRGARCPRGAAIGRHRRPSRARFQ